MRKLPLPHPHNADASPVDFEDPAVRKKLALMLMKLFEHWDLKDKEKTNLLGLSESSRGTLEAYRTGTGSIKSRDMLDRAGHLLSIHKALRLLYPKNTALRYAWVNLPNRAFDNFTPLHVMQSEGVIGIARVARYLDFIRGQ